MWYGSQSSVVLSLDVNHACMDVFADRILALKRNHLCNYFQCLLVSQHPRLHHLRLRLETWPHSTEECAVQNFSELSIAAQGSMLFWLMSYSSILDTVLCKAVAPAFKQTLPWSSPLMKKHLSMSDPTRIVKSVL